MVTAPRFRAGWLRIEGREAGAGASTRQGSVTTAPFLRKPETKELTLADQVRCTA